MNIWQDSNNAPSTPNSSTASEEEIIKLTYGRYYFKRSDLEKLNKFQNERDNKGGNKSCG